MPDVFTPKKRSEVMSRIRSTGTRPEEEMLSLLRAILGHRRRIDRNRADLPGKPDLVVPTLKLAIFVDGCFFHRCPIHGRIPDSNRDYWAPKLNANAKRDTSNRRKLRRMGYSVARFWEHELNTQDDSQRASVRLSAHVRRRENARLRA